MRKILTLTIFVALALAACAETGEPAVPTTTPAATITAPTAVATPVPQTPTEAVTSARSGAVLTPDSTEPALDTAPTPTPPSASPAPTGSESPWPRFLRELAFDVPAGNSYAPRALTVHPGQDRLYVRTEIDSPGFGETDSLTLLNSGSGRVLKVVELDSSTYSEGVLVLDANRDRVYVANPNDATTAVLEAGTLNPVTTLENAAIVALDTKGGRLYVAGPEGLAALDATTYSRLSQVPLPPIQDFLALTVDPSANRVYLAYRSENGTTLSLHDAATLKALSTVSMPGRLDEFLPDPDRGRLVTILDDGDQTLLWILDQDGDLVRKQRLGDWADQAHLALDPKGSRLFLGRETFGDYGIAVIDLDSDQQIADIPLEKAPSALAWDGRNDQLLASHTSAGWISAIDAKTGQVRDVFATAIDLVDLALDPERGHVYLTDSSERLHVLDSDSDQELALLPASGRISVDSAHGLFYTGGSGARRARIFDSDELRQTGEIQTTALPVADAYHGGLYLVENGIYPTSLETLTTTGVIADSLPQNPGYSPNPAAIDAMVDSGSGRILARITNNIPGSNGGSYLYVYEPEAYTRVLTDTERSPIYLDIDPSTGQATVSRIHLAGRSTSLLAKGREYTARLDGVFGALRIDPDLGRIYQTITRDYGSQMLILDAQNLDALDLVPVPGTILALDPLRHLFYLATGRGRVEVWSALGGQPPLAEPPAPATLAPEDIHEFFEPPAGGPVFAVDGDYRLYRSGDGGDSWLRIRGGLPDEWVLDLAFSPEFSQDQTLFAALATADQGFGIWKSTDGGQSWQMASRGLTDLAVTDLILSPDFSSDGALFALARRGGLMRSTDAAQSWTALTERYRPPGIYPEIPGNLVFSPDYARDRTLFIDHHGMQRSTDGGDTWTRIWPRTLWPLALSPAFSADHTLFGWAHNGGLLRSTDGGDTWAAASVGLTLPAWGSAQIFVPPGAPTSQALYFVWIPSSADSPLQLYRSVDNAATWEQLERELPPVTLLELATDGTAIVAETAAGEPVRWPLTELNWQAGALPPLSEIPVEHLTFLPDTAEAPVLYALSKGSGVLHSTDGGETWGETRFPVRFDLGDPEELLFVAPDSLFVGTPLGLYRLNDDQGWEPMEGGLPQGVTTSSPIVGQDGSMLVFVDENGHGRNLRVFLSTDGGQSWTQPLPDLPAQARADDVYFSPSFATDRTAYVASFWSTPLRSVAGGEWEQFGPPGASAVTQFYMAPITGPEPLIFMELDDAGLWRSSGGGESWDQLVTPWGPSSISGLTFSPAFAQDGLLWANAEGGLYRSKDRGSSWTQVLDLTRSNAQFLFPPGYEKSGEIYVVQNGALYHSVDRGLDWQMPPQILGEAGQMVYLVASPTFAQDRSLLAWQPSGHVHRSSDGGTSWTDRSTGIPPGGIKDAGFSPAYASDGLAYLIPQSGGIYKQAPSGPWRPVTEQMPAPTPRPLPSPTPRPLATPTPLTCAEEPHQFQAVWQLPEARARLGCPAQPAQQLVLGEQPFERGRLFWDSSNRQIYVLSDAGTWRAFDDTWNDDQAAIDPALVPPQGWVQPQRGFGKVWREQLDGPEAAIGWATEGERAVDGWRQRFEMGLLLWSDEFAEELENAGIAYLLYDDGHWQAVAAPRP